MTFWALDLASRVGFAAGPAGSIPRSGAVMLKQKGEDQDVAAANLLAFLNDEWSRERPALVATESALTLQAFLELHSSQANVQFHYALHGVVGALCGRYGIKRVSVHPATYRRHFLGRPHFGDRKSTKWESVLRCRLLKYVPADSIDEDRADACALWDYACATYGGKSLTTEKLYFFGQRPEHADAR